MRFPRDRFIYTNYAILDRPSFDILPFFSKSNEFIRSALMPVEGEAGTPDGVLTKGGRNGNKYRVLVYCGAGVSRSAAIVVAFLIYYHRLSLDLAYAIVKSVRPSVNPNEGFKRKLREYEEEELGA